MYHSQAVVQGFIRIADVHLFPVHIYFAFVHMVDAEEAFHQCGFAGAIFTHECMDGPGADLQIYFVESFDTGETLADPMHL